MRMRSAPRAAGFAADGGMPARQGSAISSGCRVRASSPGWPPLMDVTVRGSPSREGYECAAGWPPGRAGAVAAGGRSTRLSQNVTMVRTAATKSEKLTGLRT